MKKKILNQELIFGVHPIKELIRAKRRKLFTIYTTKPLPKVWKIIENDLPKSVEIRFVQRDVLTRMAQTSDHQSLVAFASPFVWRKKFFNPQRERFLVMIDGVQDPRNLGAILRSAYCTNVDGVILVRQKSASLTASALKASAGLAEHLELFQTASARSGISELKNAGYSIYLAALGGKDATKVNYSFPLCLVIGSEEIGISKEILHEGLRVMLPQREPDISYNASVAAGIFFFFIMQQRPKIDNPF